MKKLLIVAIAAVLGVASAAFADDLVRPPWERQSDGTTYQSWDFLTSDKAPPADSVYNPYGMPSLMVTTGNQWSDGAWPLSGEIDVFIPNRPNPFEKKEIWLQLTWLAEDLCSLPPIPLIGATGIPSSEHSEIFNMGTIDLRDDWKHTTYKINLYPNPPEEWISIKGDIMVDQVVIDTQCIPEPATLALLGAGALIVVARRRRAI